MNVDPEVLFDTRLQLHWAAQAAAGVGRTLLTAQPDDSHTNLRWNEELGALQGGLTPAGFSAALRLRDLSLLLLDGQDIVLDATNVTGKTLAEAFFFYESHFSELSGVEVMLKRPAEGMPEHGVARGAVFFPDHQALLELSRLYSDAARQLEELRRREPHASDVRCWPHHFDIASLIVVESAGEGSEARTIGVGMVPGDSGYREPYWYVTPWPYPADRAAVPPLTRGFWNQNGWFGGVLLYRDFQDDEKLVDAYLQEAVARSHQLVG